jgi:hypothetical protein
VICEQCKAENPDGKNFCSDCGFLLTPQLKPLIRSQVEEYVKEHFKDRNIVDIETTHLVADRFMKWAKWFLFPATGLLVIFAAILALLGISNYSDFHKTIRRASVEALSEADSATKKAKEATSRSEEAIRSFDLAEAKMDQQLGSVQRLSDKVAGMESQTANRMTTASKHVEDRVTDLDREVASANKEIAAQQSKLTSTNELVTAMFSKGQVETFNVSTGDTPTLVVYAIPTLSGQPQKGAIVYMLLKSAPIFQTVQINYRIFVQPKSSYHLNGNLLMFFWGDPSDNLKQFALEVSYVPDPTYKGPTYSALSLKDGHIFADKMQLQ